MSDRERLFVGVPLNAEMRARLTDHLARVSLPGRAVPPANWHLTLRFLGDTEPGARDLLIDALREARLGKRIDATFVGFGAFPRPARASVLWLGVREGVEPLRALATEVESAARRAGFAAEGREWTPHLTLARVHPPQDLRPFLAAVPPFEQKMFVDELVLFRSHLGKGPAQYEQLERFSLVAG